MTGARTERRFTRVLALWDTPLLADAVSEAANGEAEVIAIERDGVQLESLIKRVRPDVVVVESDELVESIRALNGAATGFPILAVSFDEHRLRQFRATDGDEGGSAAVFADRLRAALSRSAARSREALANGMPAHDGNGNGNVDAIGDVRLHRAGAVQPQLSVIVPTRNEAGNVAPLLSRLAAALGDESFEVIFADDSDDDTPDAVNEAATRTNYPVRLLHRPAGERANGLGGAVLAGLRVAHAPWVCVMDGDLQHPPELVPEMLERATSDDLDLVVASRYSHDEHSDENALSPLRKLVSRSTGGLAHVMFPRRLHGVSDPMSGFFLVRKSAVAVDRLRPRGFKILLEVIVRSKKLKVGEVGFDFGERHAGESKASVREGLIYLTQLARLRVASGSLRLAGFTAVGATGLVVNMLAFWLLAVEAGMHYLLAAVLATQCSTLWNFLLNERFVFRSIDKRHGFGARMGLFFLLNNAALLLRGPMLVVFISVIGVGSLLSNLLSLLALTLIRFVIADTWIWASARAGTIYAYDIHGLLSVVSEVRLPELEPFRTGETIETPTVNVRIGLLSRAQSELVASLTRLVRHTRYDEGLGRLGFGVDIAAAGRTIEVVASPLLRHSPHVLYTNVVEPILRWMFVRDGYSLVHGACLEFGDTAYLVTARTDTGKTTTILKSLDNHGSGFLSDDLTLLRPDGKVLTYPKPLTISRHTAAAVKTPLLSRRERMLLLYQSRVHSKSGRQFAFLLTKMRLPVATINTFVQLIVPPPKYSVQRLVPGVRMVHESQLGGLIVIERGHDEVRTLSHSEALEILMRNCADSYGFPPYDSIEDFLQRMTGTEPLVEQERRIVAAALAGLPATLIGSTTMEWWRQLPHLAAGEPLPVPPRIESGLVALPVAD